MVRSHIIGFAGLLMILITERLLELRSANRNFALLLTRGGKEFGSEHYRVIVMMHTLFFLSLVIEFILRGTPLPFFWPVPFTIFLLAQLLRLWSRKTMSERWTTRIIAIPDERLIAHGPFRFFRHPIYVAVALELLSLPLIFGLYFTCIIFSVFNALMLLFIRIPEEERALEWAQNLASLQNRELP